MIEGRFQLLLRGIQFFDVRIRFRVSVPVRDRGGDNVGRGETRTAHRRSCVPSFEELGLAVFYVQTLLTPTTVLASRRAHRTFP